MTEIYAVVASVAATMFLRFYAMEGQAVDGLLAVVWAVIAVRFTVRSIKEAWRVRHRRLD